CVIALTPGARTCLKHEHPLRFYRQYEGKCNACSRFSWRAFCCRDCNFVLHLRCFSLPITAQHKCDEHILSLTDHDDNDDNSYSENHYCDICEESRDPNHWLYHCATCDASAYDGCVLGEYPFLKLMSIYEEKDHPHPLTIVKKYYHPDCDKCEDLALECSKSECKYIVHWNCAALSFPHEEGEMVEPENYGHQHPLLLLLNEEQLIDNQRGVADCSMCGEKVSAPCFSCAENCGFYLHKICADAPLKLNDPFHRDHPLDLMHHSLLIKNPAY
ncbi:hypothetical protein Gotur_007266, partial [Gossypium turneri]